MAKRIDEALYRAVSHERPAAEDPRALVERAVKGLGSKRAVAERLGVSTRTVQRWVTEARERSRPSARNIGTLRSVARRSPAVRRADVSSRRVARLRSQGAEVRIRGEVGAVAAGRDYRRQRMITQRLSGESMAEILDAWLAGDDERAREALEAAMDREYMGGGGYGFALADALDELEFRR